MILELDLYDRNTNFSLGEVVLQIYRLPDGIREACGRRLWHDGGMTVEGRGKDVNIAADHGLRGFSAAFQTRRVPQGSIVAIRDGTWRIIGGDAGDTTDAHGGIYEYRDVVVVGTVVSGSRTLRNIAMRRITASVAQARFYESEKSESVTGRGA